MKKYRENDGSAMQIVKGAILYFALVFGAGFVLGPIRMMWIVPRFGVRIAELIESPVMLAVIIAASGWIVRRLPVSSTFSSRLGMGFMALGFLLAAEMLFGYWLRGLSVKELFANRDPVSGTVYYILLGGFAVMPALSASRASRK